MAALTSITAVRPTSDTVQERVIYGATIAAGVPVYLDTADGEYKIADADASALSHKVAGIAITPGVDGGYGYIAKAGTIVLVGTTMAVGITYFLGPTAGEIVLESDVASGDKVTRIGTAATATELKLSIEATDITKA